MRCRICNKDFTPRNDRAVTCSKACSLANRKNMQKTGYSTLDDTQSTSVKSANQFLLGKRP
jgi:hypothetical protein